MFVCGVHSSERTDRGGETGRPGEANSRVSQAPFRTAGEVVVEGEVHDGTNYS